MWLPRLLEICPATPLPRLECVGTAHRRLFPHLHTNDMDDSLNDLPEDDPVDDLDELNENIPTTYTITSYGADYPVDGLVRRLETEDVVVPLFSAGAQTGQAVGFQREFVWTKAQCDRFVESLLLGLPVPGIFLVKETSGRLLVLDGQQRLRTLQAFYNGVIQSKEFVLQNVQQKWHGKSYKTLHPDDRRRLDDSIIHATIIKQDEPSDDQSSVYLIFERLNSGGTFLQPQEIRVALYHGPMASLLNTLNTNQNWRKLYGKKSSRLKDLELILRFFAMLYYESSYKRPMKDFLNRYMAKNVSLSQQPAEELTSIFERTVNAICEGIGPGAFRPIKNLNAAVVDSLMVGVASRLASGEIADWEGFRTAYASLIADPGYIQAITRSTADEEFVKARLRLAREAMQGVA